MAENEKKEQQNASSKTPAKKDKSDKKPGIFARIKQWCKETKAELKKVQWPTWKQTLNNTLIVLAFCIVVGLCIFLFDLLASNLFQALIHLTH
ncbi:MAG: preprotein translocase subunit SecE [Oscillospiraceae bacterium]|nr:preprotein translocase subunit SecE [Oscillospiraceae bacterium]